MKKIIAIILIIATSFTANAQIETVVNPLTSNPSPSGGSHITTFIFNYWSSSTSFQRVKNPSSNTDHSPTYSTWVEFGDGNFASGDSIEHMYGDVSATSYNSFVKASGIYTGPVKPPANRAITLPASGIYNTGTTATTNLPNTGTKNYIKITPNVRDVSDKDTMHFAVSYRLPFSAQQGDNWYLVFVYNTGVAGTSNYVFEKINPTGTFNADGSSLNNVRNSKYFTFSTDNSINCSNLPSNSNILVYRVNDVSFHKDSARNLFITLVPKEGTTDSTETTVQAFWVKKTESRKGTYYNMPVDSDTSYSAEEHLAVRGSNPHDPNYETVRPTCLELPKKESDILHYHIHFQNTGPGDAKEVKVYTSIPYNASRIKIQAEINSIRAKYKIANEYIRPGSTSLAYSINPHLNTTQDSIIFHFTPNHSMVLAKFTNFTDVTTMGDIWFDIPLDSNVGTTLSSRSSICFKGQLGTWEAPVITNEATSVYKKYCGECDCKKNPCKKRKGIWKWLFCKKC